MNGLLADADRTIFRFINVTLANPVTDALMPALTDWNKSWVGLAVAGALIILLIWKGGRKGRIVALLFIPLILMSDQLSSSLLKNLFDRPRPCHPAPGGGMQVPGLRLLVPCGSGYSFPSSHAVNNFALAAFCSYYYRRWSGLWFLYAALMGLSRIVVGVHYPSDVFCGALFGTACAALLIASWAEVGRLFPSLRIGPEP